MGAGLHSTIVVPGGGVAATDLRQVHAVLGEVPEFLDEAIQALIGAADLDAVADDIVCGDADDAPFLGAVGGLESLMTTDGS